MTGQTEKIERSQSNLKRALFVIGAVALYFSLKLLFSFHD